MKRPIALLAGALVAAGMTVAPVPPAAAGWTTISGDNWSMTLTVSDASWSDLFLMNFTVCRELSMIVRVAVEGATDWSLSGVITPAGETALIEEFDLRESGSGEFPIPDIQMCEHFQAPSTPTDGRYEVTGVASVPSSATPSSRFATEFAIAPMVSSVLMEGHEVLGGSSVFTVGVSLWSHDGFRRPATGGTVTMDKLVGSDWVRGGEATSSSDGTFKVAMGEVLPTGSYVRVTYSGELSVAPGQQSPITVWPPAPSFTPIPLSPPIPVVTSPAPAVVVQPTARVTIKAVSTRSKLKVDVNPNMGSRYWTFQVQRRNTDGTWKVLKTYRTWGSTEKRTLNLRKGTYRVWVNPKFGHLGVMSPNEVTLRR